MAIPRVFISSTCYDLKHIRENIKYFVRTIGYEPVLSEEGSVFYNPSMHTHDSCLSEVPNCQIFVLIIGGRYGGKFKSSDDSITNEEYREAVRNKIPVFALVESAVYSDHHVFTKNKDNPDVNEETIYYPSADNTKIFKFVDEVRSNSINNAIVPFKDFSDIESYLRQQWAGMMFSFLASKNEEDRVSDMMSHLLSMNKRIEFLSSQVLKSVGSEESKVLVKLYDVMIRNNAFKALLSTGYKPTLSAVIDSEDLMECSEMLGNPLKIMSGEHVDYITTGSGEIAEYYYDAMNDDFFKMKEEINEIISKHGLTTEQIKAMQDIS